MAKAKLTDREIEEKYESGSFKLTQERNDFLLPQITDFVKNKKWVNIHPEYQRRLVWDKNKKSLFIESLIMNIPIPPIFLYEWEYSRYEVMDGQQRLSTIMDFYDNRFKLSGLEQWPDLNGRSYAELPPILQKSLDRRRISATVLLVESSAFEKSQNELRKFVFERLNTGGQKLNNQELRNCIYSGLFNNMLVELAGLPLFNDMWNMPRYEDNIRGGQINKELADHNLFKRMIDCEIVLRFFAFRSKPHVKGSFHSILDKCMERERDVPQTTIDEYKTIFTNTLNACNEIFQEIAFKIPEEGSMKLSQPIYDAEMIAVDRLISSKDRLIEQRVQIKAALTERLRDQTVFDLVVGKPGTATAIKERSEYITEFLQTFLA